MTPLLKDATNETNTILQSYLTMLLMFKNFDKLFSLSQLYNSHLLGITNFQDDARFKK